MNNNFKVNGRDLSINEYKIISNFFFEISKNTKINRQLIFRGDSFENLKTKLNINEYDNFYNKLDYFIFNLGDKGRVYQEEYRKTIKKENIFPIDCTDKIIFEHIFIKFNKIFKSSKNSEIIEFKALNKDFASYFLKKTNNQHFIELILSEPKNNQIKIRDYYLCILHKVGKFGFYNNSFFVSTTTDNKIAATFSKSIIFVGWYYYSINIELKNILSKKLLPVTKTILYSYQKEISIKGGILPHYLLGYIKKETNEFILNPNLFKYKIPILNLIKFGIPLNQDNFDEILSETNYTGYFTIDTENNYDDKNISR